MAAKQTATQKARGLCMIYSRDEDGRYSDNLISDFSDSLFQAAFKQYFSELELHIRDWDGLFREMNADGGNLAFVRTSESGNVIGFIQFKPLKFTSGFFEETCGFIREFWVADEYKNQAHGSALLALAEEHFLKNGIYTSVLTTGTAAHFYEKHGYISAPGCKAKNQDAVFVKHLVPQPDSAR